MANKFTTLLQLYSKNQNDELLAAKYHEFDEHTQYHSPKLTVDKRKPALKRAFRKSIKKLL